MTASVLLSVLPPFSFNLVQDVTNMLQFTFMQSALLAGTALAVVAGLVGYFVVLRRQLFASEALSHVGFAGVMGAAVLGIDQLAGLFGLTALVALGMGLLGKRARARDVAVGTLLAWVLGLGVFFLSVYINGGGPTHVITLGVNTLFGTILGLSPSQALLIALFSAGVILALLALLRPLLFASLDPEVAEARGLPVQLLGSVFLVLVAITVGVAIQAVGILLLFSLLVAPGAIAQRLVARPGAALLLSAALALAFTWGSLLLGFYLNYPVSFLISTLAFVSFVATLLSQWLLQRWRQRAPAEQRPTAASTTSRS